MEHFESAGSNANSSGEVKMWFMMIVKASKDCEAGKGATEKLPPAIRKFNDEMRKAGVLVELSRLHPSSKGARIKLSSGKQSVTDGPFAETKELIGGYWIIQVKSKEEAIEWARRVPVPVGEDREYEIEIRQFLEVEDFVPGEAANPAVDLGKELAKTQGQAQ
jgi:hypothetical protein